MTKRVGDYDLGTILGEGAFGLVRMATHTQTKQQFAIKIIDKEKVKREDLIESLKKEIQILMMIDHPNIVKLTEVLASKTKIYLVLEWIKGGELFDHIRSAKCIPEPKMRKYFRQIVRALLCCQAKQIAHRDLKPENILVTPEDQIKVSDFGLSSLYKDPSNNNTLYTTCGTINYLAPEVIQSTGYDGHKADIWSLGVMLYFSCAGYLPFEDNNVASLLDKIVVAKYVPFPKTFSKSLKDLLEHILVTNPYKRLSLVKITQHPWFLEDITPAELQSFEDDKQRFKSEELSCIQQNASIDVNLDQNYHVVKTSGWDLPLNEIIIIRKMGAFELITFMAGKVLNNLTQIKGKNKVLMNPITRFTSRQPVDMIIKTLWNAFDSLKPTQYQQVNAQKSFQVLFSYRASKEIYQMSFEVFEVGNQIYLIDIQHKDGLIQHFEKAYNNIFPIIKWMIE